MQKTQKTFQLPDAIATWIAKEERSSGATLSRIATAAFCCFASQVPETRRDFMELAVDLERNAVQFSDIPEVWATATIKMLKFNLKCSQESGNKKGEIRWTQELVDAEQELKDLRKRKEADA